MKGFLSRLNLGSSSQRIIVDTVHVRTHFRTHDVIDARGGVSGGVRSAVIHVVDILAKADGEAYGGRVVVWRRDIVIVLCERERVGGWVGGWV